MDLTLRKGFLANSGTKLMKILYRTAVIQFKHRCPGLAMLAFLSPVIIHADTVGICLTGGTPVYGGASLASIPGIAACGNQSGFQSNLTGGATASFTPGALPSPISTLYAGSLTYRDPGATTGNGTGVAIASLGAGTLGDYSGSTATDGTLAVSSILFDGVHFAITDGAPSALVTINTDLGGTLLGAGSYSNAFSLTFGGALGYTMQNGAFTVTNEQGWGSPSLTNESVTGFHFHGTLSVTNGETIPLLMSLQLGCSSGEICDLSHTAALSFGLPSDVTFTSDSGVLLTQTGSAVPEPASFALMGTVLVALGVFRRKGIRPRHSGS